MSLRELKRAARNDLKGKWHIGIIVTIVAFIIGVYSFGLLPMINLPAEEWLKESFGSAEGLEKYILF